MDLTLSLRYQEQNDNKAIILTDTTTDYGDKSSATTTTVVTGEIYEIAVSGTYNFTAIGAANSNVGTRFVSTADATINLGGTVYKITPEVSEITDLTLDVTVLDSSGTSTSKGTINLLTKFGPFATQDDMVYTIDAELLGDTIDSLLVDGIYTLVYTVTSTFGARTKVDTLTVSILVYGQVKVATYEKLRQIPTSYMCHDGRARADISEADLCGAFLTGIENSAYVAKTEELLAMLIELERILLNGSGITW